MAQIVVSGTTSGITVTLAVQDPNLPVNILTTGYVLGGGNFGLDLSADSFWNVVNLGTIAAPIAISGHGILIQAGGHITNGTAGGAVATIISNFGISSHGSVASTIDNFGLIIGTSYDGLSLRGGTITNGATNAATARVQGGGNGIYSYLSALAVTNFGTIAGVGDKGIFSIAGGTVTNGAPGFPGAHIVGATTGVAGGFGTGISITNFGTIAGGNSGVALYGGGSVVNGGNSDRTARIEGGTGSGVYGGNTAQVTVTNGGTITSGTTGIHIPGGVIHNGSASNHKALISGVAVGIESGASATTVDNFAMISGGVHLGNANANRVIVHAGSRITGGAIGGTGTDTIELASSGLATLSPLQGVFTGFNGLALDQGAGWKIGAKLILDGAAAMTLGAGGLLEVSGLLRTTGNLQVSGAGELAVTAGGRIAIGPAAGAALGVITVTSGRTLSGHGLLGGSVADNGTVMASGGTLAVLGDVSGPGTIAISSAALLHVTGTVSAATHISFLPGTGERLFIGQPGPDTGLIAGFGAGDTIDFGGVGLASSVTPAGPGVFTLDGLPGGAISMHFAGFHNALAFQINGDGHGGTLVTYL